MIDATVIDKHPPGYVVLGKRKGGNAYSAIIERSFSMDLAPDRASFFWTGIARDNIFGARWELTREEIFKNAGHYRDMFNKSRPDMEFEIWDVDSPDLPIVIDWADYHDACTPSDKKVSGVRNKFRARNLKFEMKGDDVC